MAIKRQTFDNGNQNDTITSANSASSGDALSAVSVSGAGKAVYEVAAAIRGAKGAHVTGGSGDTFQVILANTSAVSGTASVFLRIVSYPSTGGVFFSLNSSTAIIAAFSLSSTGVLSIQNSVGVGLKNFVSSTPLALNTVYHLALQGVPNASTTSGYISGQLYSETGTLLDSYTSGSVNANTTLNVQTAQVGKLISSSANFDMHFDDLALDTGNINQINPLPLFYRNTAEGGTDGLTVTTGNSGGASGTAFYQVFPSTGTIVYSSEQAHTGTYSYKVTPGSVTSAKLAYSWWNGNNTLQMSTSAYVYLTGLPTTGIQFLYINNAVNTCANLGISGSGRPFLQDIDSTINNGVTVLPLATWLRFELTVIVGTSSTTGTIIASIFSGDSMTSLYSFTTTSKNTGTSPLAFITIGKGSNAGDMATMYIDDFTVTDAALPVPINTAVAPWVFA